METGPSPEGILFDDGRVYVFVGKHITEAKFYPAKIAKQMGYPERCVEIVVAGRVTRIDVQNDEEGQTFIDSFVELKGAKVNP